MADSYTKTVFNNGAAPALSAEELNKMGQGVEDAFANAAAARAWPKFYMTDPPLSEWQENRIWERTDVPITNLHNDRPYRVYIRGNKYNVNPFNTTLAPVLNNGLVVDSNKTLWNSTSGGNVGYTWAYDVVGNGSSNSLTTTMNISATGMSFGGQYYFLIDPQTVKRIDVTWSFTTNATYGYAFLGLDDGSSGFGSNFGGRTGGEEYISRNSSTGGIITQSLTVTGNYSGFGSVYLFVGAETTAASSATSIDLQVHKIELFV